MESSKQDQKLWDDQIVVATKYIGPLSVGSVTSDGPGVDFTPASGGAPP